MFTSISSVFSPKRPSRLKMLAQGLDPYVPRHLAVMLGIVICATCVQPAWADAPCKVIQFKPGASSATVSGSVDPDATQCFHFSTRKGQTVRIAIQSQDQNTIFSITDLVDARAKYEFKSQKKTYEIIIGQLMRSATADTYQLTLSIE